MEDNTCILVRRDVVILCQIKESISVALVMDLQLESQ